MAKLLSEKNEIKPATLYLVATPIGNLDDISFRALKVLRAATLVAAEDTRHTQKLLTHFEIKPPKILSCFEHNEVKRVEEILAELRSGGTVALVSDAGMPGVSDPGAKVVAAVLQEGFPAVPVPGAAAVLAALTVSGLPTTPFYFAGFLPPKAEARREALMRLKSEEATLVFYEAPHRLRECLKDMMNVFGARKGVAARELTKLHEEFVRGNLQELWKIFKGKEALGEFTIVVEGAEHREGSRAEDWVGVSIEDQLSQFMQENGLSKTEAVKAVCRLRDLPREVVYKIAMQIPVPGDRKNENDVVDAKGGEEA